MSFVWVVQVVQTRATRPGASHKLPAPRSSARFLFFILRYSTPQSRPTHAPVPILDSPRRAHISPPFLARGVDCFPRRFVYMYSRPVPPPPFPCHAVGIGVVCFQSKGAGGPSPFLIIVARRETRRSCCCCYCSCYRPRGPVRDHTPKLPHHQRKASVAAGLAYSSLRLARPRFATVWF